MEKGCRVFLVTGDTLHGIDFAGVHLTYPLSEASCLGGWETQNSAAALAAVTEIIREQSGEPWHRLVVMDRYDLSLEWICQLKKVACQVGYLDDYHHQFPEADFLLNHQVGAEKEILPGGFYHNLNTLQVLAGGTYALLRKGFRNLPAKKVVPSVKHLLIATGGGAQQSWQKKLLMWTNDKCQAWEAATGCRVSVHLLTGTQGQQFHQWEARVGMMTGVQVYPRLTAEQVASLMKTVDLAVSAGGGTLYELAAWGVPTLALVLADNQKAFVDAMDKNGLVKSLGWHEALEEHTYGEELLLALQDIDWRRSTSRHMQQLVDGRGPERAAAVLLGE